MDLPSKLSPHNFACGLLTSFSHDERTYDIPDTSIVLYYYPKEERPFLNISSVAACAYYAADLIFEAILNRKLNYLDHPPSDAPQRTCSDNKNGAYLHVGYLDHNEDLLNWMQLAQIFQGLATAVQPPKFFNYDCTILIYNGRRPMSAGYQSSAPKNEPSD